MRRALWFGLAIALAPFVLVIALVIAVIGVPGGPVLAPGTVPAAYSGLRFVARKQCMYSVQKPGAV